jgi:hypothetical protein
MRRHPAWIARAFTPRPVGEQKWKPLPPPLKIRDEALRDTMVFD